MRTRGTRPGPVDVRLVDLDQPSPPSADVSGRYAQAWLVGFRSGAPVGIVEVDLTEGGEALQSAGRELASMDPASTPPAVEDADLPRISVVIPTVVGRTEELERCLHSLEELDYPDVEVLLVDNRRLIPDLDPLPGLLERFRFVRPVRAEQPGISAARNAGIDAATGSVVVFTDDDVRVHPGWLRAIGSRFARDPSLAAVTGLILPAELETPAQIHFERYYGGFSGVRTFVPLTLTPAGTERVRDRARVVVRDAQGEEQRTFALYGVGAYGAGANMAFAREVLLDLGRFDLALGTGTRARGGEDLATLVDVLWSGRRVGYEPAAVVFHQHRRTDEELVRQLGGNGLGFTAMLTSVVLADPRHALAIAGQLPLALRRTLTQSLERLAGRRTGWPQRDRHQSGKAYPRRLVLHEFAGMLRGPVAYLRSRQDAQRWVAPPPRTADPVLQRS